MSWCQNIFWLFGGPDRSFVVAADNSRHNGSDLGKQDFPHWSTNGPVITKPHKTPLSIWHLCCIIFSVQTKLMFSVQKYFDQRFSAQKPLRLIRYEGRYILLKIDNNQITFFTPVNLNHCLSLCAVAVSSQRNYLVVRTSASTTKLSFKSHCKLW